MAKRFAQHVIEQIEQDNFQETTSYIGFERYKALAHKGVSGKSGGLKDSIHEELVRTSKRLGDENVWRLTWMKVRWYNHPIHALKGRKYLMNLTRLDDDYSWHHISLTDSEKRHFERLIQKQEQLAAHKRETNKLAQKEAQERAQWL